MNRQDEPSGRTGPDRRRPSCLVEGVSTGRSDDPACSIGTTDTVIAWSGGDRAPSGPRRPRSLGCGPDRRPEECHRRCRARHLLAALPDPRLEPSAHRGARAHTEVVVAAPLVTAGGPVQPQTVRSRSNLLGASDRARVTAIRQRRPTLRERLRRSSHPPMVGTFTSSSSAPLIVAALRWRRFFSRHDWLPLKQRRQS